MKKLYEVHFIIFSIAVLKKQMIIYFQQLLFFLKL